MKLVAKRFKRLLPKQLRRCSVAIVLLLMTCTYMFIVRPFLALFAAGECDSDCLAGGAGFNMDQFYYHWDVGLCKYLDLLFAGQKVLELGAGYGFYGRCLLRLNDSFFPNTPVIDQIFFKQVNESGLNDHTAPRIASWTGCEHPSRIATSSSSQVSSNMLVTALDIGSDFYLEREFDWAFSLDTSRVLALHQDHESLPRRIFVFCRNIARHVRNGIVLSLMDAQAGIMQRDGRTKRGQSRLDDSLTASSLSIQSKLDVALRRFGFVSDDRSQKYLRKAATSPWFRRSLRIYVKVDS